MNERDKAAAGLLYDANFDPEVLKERAVCNDLCYEYNQIRPSCEEERRAFIRKLFGRTTENFTVMQPFYCDYGSNIEIGDYFFSNYNCVILDAARVTFGDFVFIAPNCGFYTAGHPLDIERRNQGLEYAYPITVGDNVWIGANVAVMPGVTIGNGVVIGAGSIVTRDIPDNVLAAGNPCRILREITDADKSSYVRRPDARAAKRVR